MTPAEHRQAQEQARIDAAYIWLAEGRSINLLNPSVEDVDWRDIVQGLSNINRFNGRTKTPWSVAQHSCLVCDLVDSSDPYIRLAALLHDAHEVYIGDIITPIKTAIIDTGSNIIDDLSTVIDSAIFTKANLVYPLPDHAKNRIKAADTLALYLEYEYLFLKTSREWKGEFITNRHYVAELAALLGIDAEELTP